jgi:hypothetical protein
LPSVDREDEGKIIGTQSILECKICKWFKLTMDYFDTEMIFAGRYIQDGSYILNLQFTSFEMMLRHQNYFV